MFPGLIGMTALPVDSGWGLLKQASFPLGLRTSVEQRGKAFPNGFVTQVMVARAVVTRPSVLVLERALPGLDGLLRERILRRLCAKKLLGLSFLLSVTPISPFMETAG